MVMKSENKFKTGKQKIEVYELNFANEYLRNRSDQVFNW